MSPLRKTVWTHEEALFRLCVEPSRGWGNRDLSPADLQRAKKLLLSDRDALNAESDFVRIRTKQFEVAVKEGAVLGTPFHALHPCIWFRLLLTQLGSSWLKEALDKLWDWHTAALLRGELHVMLSRKADADKWNGPKLRNDSAVAIGRPIYAFITEALSPSDVHLVWKMKKVLVEMPRAQAEQGTSKAGPAAKPVRQPKGRGTAATLAVEGALISLLPDGKGLTRRSEASTGVRFDAPGMGREELLILLQKRDARVRRYAESTLRPILSALVATRLGAGPKS